jgi:hypothetical protein
LDGWRVYAGATSCGVCNSSWTDGELYSVCHIILAALLGAVAGLGVFLWAITQWYFFLARTPRVYNNGTAWQSEDTVIGFDTEWTNEMRGGIIIWSTGEVNLIVSVLGPDWMGVSSRFKNIGPTNYTIYYRGGKIIPW